MENQGHTTACKEQVSASLGLVDFVVGQVNLILHLPDKGYRMEPRKTWVLENFCPISKSWLLK